MCIFNGVYVHIKMINLLLITNYKFWIIKLKIKN
jgi:hypothetical protein